MLKKRNKKLLSSIFLISMFFICFPIQSIAQDLLCNLHQTSIKGPSLSCTSCHSLPYPGYFTDNQPLAGTGVCNPCHSPDGQFDGVNDPQIGAKANWKSGGVYEGNTLKPGREKWCVTCHDEGSSAIQGVDAPNIAGQVISGDSDWRSPKAVISPTPPSGVDTLVDDNIATGSLIGEVILDLGDSMELSHIRLYTGPNMSAQCMVYGSNDLNNWVKVVLGQSRIFAAPSWEVGIWELGPLEGWNQIRIDKFIPVRYIKLVKMSPWGVPGGSFREFEFKRDLRYGYYDTGHKMSCTQCHDTAKTHIDANTRTYTAASSPYNDQDPNNYQNGYRLKMVEINGTTYPPLEIPRVGINGGDKPKTDNDFILCFKCHDKYKLLGDAYGQDGFLKNPLETNFCNLACIDVNGQIINQHLLHLRGRGGAGNTRDWDSDWNGVPDSPQSCTACHNVHGSPSPAMIRHGELISNTPDLNKSPALNLYYLNKIGHRDENVSLMESIGGVTQFHASGPGAVWKNGICNMCHNDSMIYWRTPVEVLSCITCHNQPFENTRTITGENGDFVRASHHVTNGTPTQIVKDPDCQACHDQTRHTEGKVRLRNLDGGAPCTYDPQNPLSVEAACLSCHDSDFSVPFSDEVLAPNIENGSTWSLSAHATGGNALVSVTCMGNGLMTGCHSNAHGSQKPSLLAPDDTVDPTEEGVCAACHNGQLVAKDISLPFQKSYRHPIERSSLHQSDESGVNLGLNNRHAECLDCHNPHAAGSKTHTPTGNLIASNSVLKGAWGVEPIPQTGLLPGQQIYRFQELKPPAYPQGSTKEYQLCFKCHSYYALDWAANGVTNLVGPSGDKITDQAMEFSPANRSAHPVVMETASQPGAYSPKGLTSAQLKAPWDSNVGHQTMYCSDCHGTDAVNTLEAQGPHGSNYRFMLKDPSGGSRVYWPERPDGRPWGLNDLRSSRSDWQNKLFCAICHPLYSGRFFNNAHSEEDHEGALCVNCHTAVPHGSAVSRLIAYRTDPAPYNYKGYAKITGFKKASSPNGYDEDNCAAGCEDHESRINGDPAASNPLPPANQPPVAMAGPDQLVEPSEKVIFYATGSYDPDGSISSYQWNFGDSKTAQGSMVIHSYTTVGTYSVTLTVTDNDGAQGIDTAIVTVAPNQNPISEAGPAQTISINRSLSFSGTGSSDSDGTISLYQWDFGDGQKAGGISTTHVYIAPGTYTVTLTVTDNDGAKGSDTTTITVVPNQPPVAEAGANRKGYARQAISFSGAGSSDPDGTISRYQWNFGDGENAEGVSVAHAYASAGTYTITLTVTDDAGAIGTDTTTATIEAVQPITPFPNQVLRITSLYSWTTSDSNGYKSDITSKFINGIYTDSYTIERYSSSDYRVITMNLNTDPSPYSQISLQVYVTSLSGSYSQTIRVYAYNADNNTVDTSTYLDFSITGTNSWKSLDVTSLAHRMDGTGRMRFRLTCPTGRVYLSEGKFDCR